MSWIKPLCIGLAVLVGARISSVNHLGQLEEIICEALFGSLVYGSLARSLSFCHPFFDPPYLLPTPKRNTVRFLGRYSRYGMHLPLFPCCKILNYNRDFLVINSMNLQCIMCFIFFKHFQFYLR